MKWSGSRTMIGAKCYNILQVAIKRNWLFPLTIATCSHFGLSSDIIPLLADSMTIRLCETFFCSTLIPDDAPLPSSTPNSNLRETKRDKEQRESNATIDDNPREPTTILFNDNDFASEPASPIESYFTFLPSSESAIEEDPAIALVYCKQHKIAVLHERFGHLSFYILKLMAHSGLIYWELENVDSPTCPGCAYGKAHRSLWRRKGVGNRKILKIATVPGQVMSVDQLFSPTRGFVPTHRGTPTTKRYIGATVFMEHFSNFTYARLMTEMNAEAIVEAKLAFERVYNAHGVWVTHYHEDNGLFDTKAFKASVTKAQQTLSFCGVNAHHKNGKAEQRIKDATEGARTSLMHADHRWPKAVSPFLLPAALKITSTSRSLCTLDSCPGEKRVDASCIIDTTAPQSLDYLEPN